MKATLDLVATSDARRLLSVTVHQPAAPCATLLLVKCQTPTSLLIRVVIFRSTGVRRALSQWRRAHFAKCAVKIGIVSISDRASTGVYEDKGLPALQDWLTRALHNPITFLSLNRRCRDARTEDRQCMTNR